MALKIRLRQQGRRNHKVYRVVVADCRSPRDGKYIESIGWYDPTATQEDRSLHLQIDRAQHWIALGAEPTDKTKALIEKAAPQIMRDYVAKQVAARTKTADKRKARKEAVAK